MEPQIPHILRKSNLKNTPKDKNPNQHVHFNYSNTYFPSNNNSIYNSNNVNNNGQVIYETIKKNKIEYNLQSSVISKLINVNTNESFINSDVKIYGSGQKHNTAQTLLFNSNQKQNKLNITNDISRFRLFQNQESIQTVFRYCFCCQNLILQHNMDQHEKKCQYFQIVCQKSPQQLVKLAQQKIQNIKKQMEQLLKLNDKTPIQKLNRNIQDFMDSSQKLQQGDIYENQFQSSYLKIKECYASRQLKLLELSYKLRWFIKIRQQMKNKFGI